MGEAVNTALLEERIKRLEDAVASLRGANTDSTRAGGKPPKPTGLTYSNAPGIIAFEWDSTSIADFLHYRIEISTDEGMTNAFATTSVDPRFAYYEGVADTVYYARVATVNRSERSSDWTSPVASEVGLVDSTILDTSTNVVLSRYVQTSFAATYNLATGGGVDDDEATFGYLSVTCDSDHSIVDVKVSAIGALDTSFPSSGAENWMRLTLLRRSPGGTDSAVWQVQRDFSYARGGSGSTGDEEFIAFPPFAEEPGAGEWEYRLKIAIHRGGSNTITFTPSDVRIVAITYN